MKWQEKVRYHIDNHPISQRKLAKRIDMSDTALGAALESDDAWDTVRKAIRLAREMGTTVEYLFDAEADWPPEPMLQPASEAQRKWAIEELGRIARGEPPAGSHGAKRKARITRRRSE